MDTNSTDPASAARPTLRERYEQLKDRYKDIIEEYGTVALVTYLSIFALTLGGFVVAIKLGYTPESGAGYAGVVGVAYGATKVVQPLRIGATIVLTPVIAQILRRRSGGAEA
ncbi:MAG: hypothetical protein AAFV53_28790 [Myxococcota bacterium]